MGRLRLPHTTTIGGLAPPKPKKRGRLRIISRDDCPHDWRRYDGVDLWGENIQQHYIVCLRCRYRDYWVDRRGIAFGAYAASKLES